MTEPTQAVKQPEMDFTYAVDQQVSVNAFLEVEINGEAVKFQITSRYNSSADKIVKTAKAAIEAYSALRAEFPKPTIAASQRQESGESKKFELKPVPAAELPEELPEGIEAYAEDFDELEITPVVDGKVSIAFYKDKLEFPIGARINKWKIENAAQILAPLGEYDLTKAQRIRAAGVQYWSKGNEYTITQGARKGEKSHYKDLRLIRARY